MTSGNVHILPKLAETLSLVALADVRSVWPLISDRLAKLAERNDWIPEDVFFELTCDRASLFITPGAKGFVVACCLRTRWANDFHCWIADNETLANAIDYLPQMKVMARERGCSAITFESDRRWERAMPEAVKRFTYSIPVGEA